MTKHIIGLALFSFIVGASAIVYAVFNVPEIVPVSETESVSTPQFYGTMNGYSCKKNSKAASIKIRQAVFNLQTKEFNWELATPAVNERIALHFFSKDASGTRYINTEQINNKFSHNGALKFSDSYRWLNKRGSYDNLYVVAQFESDSRHGLLPVEFDASKATAVTVDYGK